MTRSTVTYRDVFHSGDANADVIPSLAPGFYSYPWGDYRDEARLGPFATYVEASRGEHAKPAQPAPCESVPTGAAKPARLIVRSIAALPAMLAIVAMVGPVHADPVNAPLESNASLHYAAMRRSEGAISHRPNPFTAPVPPAHADALRARVTAFVHSLHAEAHGEWNCAPRVCEQQLRAYGLTWPVVRANWR